MTDGNVTTRGGIRKRAAEACTFCRRRKVCQPCWCLLPTLSQIDQMQCGEADMRKLQDAWVDMQL